MKKIKGFLVKMKDGKTKTVLVKRKIHITPKNAKRTA